MTVCTRTPNRAAGSTALALMALLLLGAYLPCFATADLLPRTAAALQERGSASTEDRIAIQELLSLYAHLYDDYETERWVELFLPEATFKIAYRSGGPKSRSIWKGHQEILAHLVPRKKQFHQQGLTRRHFLANPLVFDLTSTQARVSAYLVLTTTHPDGHVTLAGTGRYDGRVLKTDQGWRIEAWRFTPDGDPVDFTNGM